MIHSHYLPIAIVGSCPHAYDQYLCLPFPRIRPNAERPAGLKAAIHALGTAVPVSLTDPITLSNLLSNFTLSATHRS